MSNVRIRINGGGQRPPRRRRRPRQLIVGVQILLRVELEPTTHAERVLVVSVRALGLCLCLCLCLGLLEVRLRETCIVCGHQPPTTDIF
jgi:hypothetical protein